MMLKYWLAFSSARSSCWPSPSPQRRSPVPQPSSRFEAAEPAGLPADWRQPLTLARDSAPVLTAQPQPQGGPESDRQPPQPLQNNTNFGVGPRGQRIQNAFNIQAVISVPLSTDLLLVTRTNIPCIHQPTSASGHEDGFGLGDINPAFFVSHERNAASPAESVPPSSCPRPHSRSPARANRALAQQVSSWLPPGGWCSALWPTWSGPLLDQAIDSQSTTRVRTENKSHQLKLLSFR